ncbi:MAG: hypothetical protein AAGB26_07420 [Planctomycetota bacterium]
MNQLRICFVLQAKQFLQYFAASDILIACNQELLKQALGATGLLADKASKFYTLNKLVG